MKHQCMFHKIVLGFRMFFFLSKIDESPPKQMVGIYVNLSMKGIESMFVFIFRKVWDGR